MLVVRRRGTISHALVLYTKRRKWRTERRALKKSLAEIGILWQRRPEKKIASGAATKRKGGRTDTCIFEGDGSGGREGTAEKAIESDREWIKRVKNN